MASIRKRVWPPKADPADQQTAWVLDYRDNAGKRRLKTFPTQKAAKEWSVTALHEVQQGVHTPASTSITVAEGMELWISDCEANDLEYGTIKQRKEHKRLHVDPFIGRDKLSALTTPRIHEFDSKLRAGGRSLAMRRKVLTNVKTMLTFCQSKGLVAQNVARGVKLKSDTRNDAGPIREGIDFPGRAELRTIMEKATGRWRPLVVTAIFTGMRASELRGLPWSSVDLDAGTIHVRQRADAWGTLGKPKSKAGSRDIPLPPMAVNTLRQWRKDCPAGDLDLVFPNGAGNVESHQNIVNRFWHPLQVANGMAVDRGERDEAGTTLLAAKYGFHALRHTAASLFIAHLGWTPKRVQTVMGHSSITMTFDRYGHLFEDHATDRESMKKLEAAIVAA